MGNSYLCLHYIAIAVIANALIATLYSFHTRKIRANVGGGVVECVWVGELHTHFHVNPDYI